MKIIGITGGTGAGKTTALMALRALGALVIDADAVYHRLTEESLPLRQALESRFGPLYDDAGRLERKKLGKLVFANPEALEDLNRLTHSHVGEEIARMIAAARKEGLSALAIDAIELIASGLGDLCDARVAVLAPKEVRIARIMAREGIAEDYARLRVEAQKDEAYFREHCDYLLENSGEGSIEDFSQRAKALFSKIISGGGEIDMEEKKENVVKQRKKELFLNREHGYDKLGDTLDPAIEEYSAAYKRFLDEGKTERECVAYTVKLAEEHGFRPFARGMQVKSGDKLYRVNRDKAVMLAVIGKKTLGEGARIGAAHIDSPRLDLKQYPLYEDKELAYLKTHYYGGVRKYQWVAIPLELRGLVVKADGSSQSVCIGADPGDPILTVTDLLPHLAADQSKKPLGEAIAGEQLNLLVGSRPFKGDEGSERVKLAVMELLHQKYGLVEEDFLSAELMAVPAFSARDVGLDRSMIGAYGQDDRVCAYAALISLLEAEDVQHTAVCMLADKEEIGSAGVTGMKSWAFDTFMKDLCEAQGESLRACYENSFCLSADVTAAFDPNYPEVYEKQNSAYLNYGICISKYTGSRGKAAASDASAETVGFLRRLLNEKDILWQTAELGKIDQGGGGTVAAYMAERNIETLDAGVPTLSMHSPFEVVSKLDCYMTCQALAALYRS